MPKSIMSSSDYLAVRRMVTGNVLLPLRANLFPQNGFVKVLCPDGDTTPEAIRYFHYGICEEANGESVCTHLASVTGGPGAIPRHSPMNALTYKGEHWGAADKLIFATIEGALTVKGRERIKNVALAPHCPCGMATLTELSVMENLFLTIQAKGIIKKEFPGTFDRIVITPHINFTGYPEADRVPGAFRTYMLDEEQFQHMYVDCSDRARKVLMTAV